MSTIACQMSLTLKTPPYRGQKFIAVQFFTYKSRNGETTNNPHSLVAPPLRPKLE